MLDTVYSYFVSSDSKVRHYALTSLSRTGLMRTRPFADTTKFEITRIFKASFESPR